MSRQYVSIRKCIKTIILTSCGRAGYEVRDEDAILQLLNGGDKGQGGDNDEGLWEVEDFGGGEEKPGINANMRAVRVGSISADRLPGLAVQPTRARGKLYHRIQRARGQNTSQPASQGLGVPSRSP